MEGFVTRTFAMAVSLFIATISAFSQTSDVQISHATTAAGDLPGLTLQNGAPFEVLIFDTDTSCFEYSLNGTIATPAATAQVRMMMGGGTIDREVLRTTHRERVLKYTIRAAKRSGVTCTGIGANLADKTWTVAILPFWNLSVSGAFVFDGVTNHIFFLEPGKGRLTGDTADRDGFYVRENGSGRDDYRSTLGAMMHLYYDSKGVVDWVPFSFGFSVANNEPTYFVSPGLGLRLGTRVYFTGGAAFGKRNRLPNGLRPDQFVIDSKALDTLPPAQSKVTWFGGISVSFVEIPLSKFRTLFGSP
jgi:hypothetical protein